LLGWFQRERYQENFSREYSAGRTDFNVPPTFSSVNPQPAQAKRFLRQAQEDLRAADNDYDAEEPAFEWVCFKAHQVLFTFSLQCDRKKTHSRFLPCLSLEKNYSSLDIIDE